VTADRFLLLLLRANAAILLCALPCALLPFEWMDAAHRWLGLGPLPDAPISRYLARSLSLVYGMHGAVVLGVTLRWPRYKPAVPFLVLLHVALGAALLAVDLTSGVPWWWALTEGPGLVAYGLFVLFVFRRASSAPPSAL
jgi:hypothetical protein